MLHLQTSSARWPEPARNMLAARLEKGFVSRPSMGRGQALGRDLTVTRGYQFGDFLPVHFADIEA